MAFYPKGTRPLTQAEKRKSREKRYKATLKTLEKFGIYQPKDKALTRYRITQINKLSNEFKDVVSRPELFLAAKTTKLTKKQKADAIAKATEQKMMVAKDAIIVSREGHTSASLRYYKSKHEFGIVRRGKIKTGVNKGLRIKNYMSLGGIDALDNEKERLMRQAARLGKLGPNQSYVFRVIVDGDIYGHSHSTYEDIDLMFNHLSRYHQGNIGQNIAFMRLIEIDKREWFEWKAERDEAFEKHTGKRARRIRANRKLLKNGRNS